MQSTHMFSTGRNFAPRLRNYGQNESTGGQQQPPVSPQGSTLYTVYPLDMSPCDYSPRFYQCFQQQPQLGLYQTSVPSRSTTSRKTSDEHLVPLAIKVYPPQFTDKAERQTIFSEANGRLCLLNQCTKYKITVGEISRRMNAPETLHASFINGILRHSKGMDNANLRSKLKDFNLELPPGRRKTCATTGFTALCELEAAELARDLCMLLEKEGGAKDIAAYLWDQHIGCDFKEEISIFEKWMSNILAIHPEDADPDDLSPTNAAEEAVHHLSLLTHGFSHRAIPLVLRFAISISDQTAEMRFSRTSRNLSTPVFPKAPGGNPMMFPMNGAPSETPFGDITNAFSNAYFMPAMYTLPPQQHFMNVVANSFNKLVQNTPPQPRISPLKLESKIYKPLLEDKQDRIQKVDEVPGRLLLHYESRKYVVSAGEVCRRMDAPETLNTSLINGILRNGKSKGQGVKLRTTLAKFKIELPQGQRKSCKQTKFTALCEAEAGALASDFERLLLDKKHGGFPEIGKHLATTTKENGDDVRREIAVVKKWLQLLIQLHPREQCPEDIEPKNSAERAINHLSLMTHGFSHIAIPAVLEFAMKILEHVESARPILQLTSDDGSICIL